MKKAVLFIIFNRFEETKKVFEQIRYAKPPRFYIVSDGPRHSKDGEKELVEEIRNWVLDNIDWDCEVHTRFMDENLGCGFGIYKALNWFFENEPDGIILEDDCVPVPSFFSFCEETLDMYKDNKKVWHISGSNFLTNMNIKESYFFSKIMHGWGWATWADRWQHFEFDMKHYNKKHIKNISKDKSVQTFWLNILSKMKQHEIEAWDYQWLFEIVKNKGVCITPKDNLVSNIGFFGVHFNNAYGHHRLNRGASDLFLIKHPDEIYVDDKIMDEVYEKVFLINRKKSVFSILLKCIHIYFKCRV